MSCWRKKHKVLYNCIITIAVLAVASLFCLLLQMFVSTDSHVPLIFVLAVLFISRFTDGYVYGVMASMLAVIGVNFVFTYPYFEINFTITGYPLTFLSMLAVAISVSALTTQIKMQEAIRLEVEKEKMRGNLLRAVSHDIRTPLTSIMGSASAILDNDESIAREEQLELIRDIKEEAHWLIRVVENLLSVTRINGESTKINTEVEVVEEVIGSAVVKFEKRFPDVKIEVEVPHEVLMVPMDAILIEQVIVNLLENSVIHGKTTSYIAIKAQADCVKNQIIITVEDDGEGIKENILPTMFDGKLSSDSGEDSDSKRNMGIGLSVCMSIVKAHKGDMRAENKASGGAKIMFTLPMHEEEK